MIEIKNNKTIENEENKKDDEQNKIYKLNEEKSILSFIIEQKNRIKNQLTDGIKKYYKLIILITITIIIIFYVNRINPKNYNLHKTIGGANSPTAAKPSTPATPAPAAPSPPKPATPATPAPPSPPKPATPATPSTPKTSAPKSSTSTPSTPSMATVAAATALRSQGPLDVSSKGCLAGPFDGTISAMYKVWDYTFFIYLVIIMILIVPSMPIFLYMAVIYFILANLFSILQTK
jgi:hypothetical protein